MGVDWLLRPEDTSYVTNAIPTATAMCTVPISQPCSCLRVRHCSLNKPLSFTATLVLYIFSAAKLHLISADLAASEWKSWPCTVNSANESE